MSIRISTLRRGAHLACAALIMAASACGSGGGSGNNGVVPPTTPTPPSSVLSSINVTLSAATLQLGQTATATATGLDQNGAATTLSDVTWASSNTSVATVSASGTITATGAGTAVITASSGGKTGSATITVIVGPTISGVIITLSASTAIQGQKVQASAAAIDQTGATIPSGGVTWSSSNTVVATIDSTGVITALSPGTTTITGRIDGHSGQATFTVTTVPVASVSISPANVSLNIGGTQLMSVTVRDASGNTLTGRQVTWSSSDPTKASVSPTGTVQAIAAGTTTIVATSEGKSASATVTVTAPAPTQPATPSCTPASALQPALG